MKASESPELTAEKASGIKKSGKKFKIAIMTYNGRVSQRVEIYVIEM